MKSLKKPKPILAPGSHVVQRPELVRVRFQRRRARQLLRLRDQGSIVHWSCYQAPRGIAAQGNQI